MPRNEQVLVVPRAKLFPDEAFRGFSEENLDRTLEAIKNHAFFMDRAQAENDPSHKQIIPYIVLTSGEKIFTVVRLKGQGESRLHQKVSIGLGGHINPEDAGDAKPAWEAALERELSEEVFIGEPWEARLIGLLNDDETPVGSVHLGLVHQVELPSARVSVREKDKMSGSFLALAETAREFERMESWSQFVFAARWPQEVLLPER